MSKVSNADKVLARQLRELDALAKLAIPRTRKVVLPIATKIGDAPLRAALLSAVANDLMDGAATVMAVATGMPKRRMFKMIVSTMKPIERDARKQGGRK